MLSNFRQSLEEIELLESKNISNFSTILFKLLKYTLKYLLQCLQTYILSSLKKSKKVHDYKKWQ